MKKFMLFLAVIVIAAIAFYAGGQFQSGDDVVMDDTMPEDVEEEMVITASFTCDNQSSFIAEFSPSMNEVTISSEGESNTFAQVASPAGKMYENNLWSFYFRGEEALVTDKTLNTTTTCTPPLDPNNAPVNFGD